MANDEIGSVNRLKMFIRVGYFVLAMLLAYVSTNLDNNMLGSGFGIASGMYFAYATEPFWNYRKGRE